VKEIILIGGGGHCKSVIDVIELEGRFKITGIVEKSEIKKNTVEGYSVIGTDDDLKSLSREYEFAFITVGQIYSSNLRKQLFQRILNLGFKVPTIISPRAYISKSSFADIGTVIMHDALINANTKIGMNCIINSKALIEHDCIVHNDCHISTGATVNGGVIIERGSFIGSRAVTKESTIIKENSFIKAGSVAK
jgi:sugar O-acyltransferase (sialic acid O-acetyltransferase NeuD family)